MVRPALGLAVEPGIIRAAAVRHGRPEWLASTSWSSAQDLEAGIAALAAERPRGFHRVTVSAGGRPLHFKIVSGLPPLSPVELRRHVAVTASKYFFDADQTLVTDAAPLGRGAGEAVLVAWRADLALAVWRGCRAAGLELADIVPRPLAAARFLFGAAARPEPEWTAAIGAALTAGAAVSLLPAEVRRHRRQEKSRRLRRGMAAIAATFVVCFALHVAYLWQDTVSRQHILAELAPRERRAAAIRRDVDDARDALAALEHMARTRGVLLPLLGELTRLLPDSSFLTTLTVGERGEVQLVGFARNGMAILAAVERVPGATGAAYDGGLSRESLNGVTWDRFGIRFRHAAWDAGR